MYRDIIVQIYRNPFNYGEMPDADLHAHDANTSCGDVIDLFIKLDEENKVKDVKFTGHGCVISKVSASLVTENIKGKKIDELESLDRDFVLDLLKEMLDLEVSPARIKCATLSLKAVKLCVLEWKKKREESLSNAEPETETED